jgi:EpsI family protein
MLAWQRLYFKEAGIATIPVGRGNPSPDLKVNRAFMEKAVTKQMVYFWFPMRGRILTKLYQVKIANFWDALTRQRTDGALVRIITPIYRDEERARLK